jgi:hypothetical protein
MEFSKSSSKFKTEMKLKSLVKANKIEVKLILKNVHHIITILFVKPPLVIVQDCKTLLLFVEYCLILLKFEQIFIKNVEYR